MNNNIVYEKASFIAESVCSGSFVDNAADGGNTYITDTYVIRLNDFALKYWYIGCCREVSRDSYEDGPDGDIEWHNGMVLVSYYKKIFHHYITNNLNIEEKGNIYISQIASEIFSVLHTYKA